jgi:hypothetical protein
LGGVVGGVVNNTDDDDDDDDDDEVDNPNDVFHNKFVIVVVFAVSVSFGTLINDGDDDIIRVVVSFDLIDGSGR